MTTQHALPVRNDREQTLASFHWQWAHLPQGDFMPGDPWFDANAERVLAEELCGLSRQWFAGKRVLDAGCGQGRWTRPLLGLGARVTAVDYSEAGLRRTRELVGATDRLKLRQVDLLNIPSDLAEERFDLVFSFGVLHHTGDTWRALNNIARLVGERGALFLYLYGARSWDARQRGEIERVRLQLAPLPFERKITELRRRFPHDDPHQLFDLLSPVINDRVLFGDVASRLHAQGFSEVDRTIDHTENYVRAVRPGFPAGALLSRVGRDSEYLTELSRRGRVRAGVAFEQRVRAALADVPPRPAPRPLEEVLKTLGGAAVEDWSFTPDRVRSAAPPADVSASPVDPIPGVDAGASADVVVFAGAAVGTCRFPEIAVQSLWRRVRPGGHLLVELWIPGVRAARRTFADKLLDYGAEVPEKIARLLQRRRRWSTGEAIYAVGGETLLNPVTPARAAEVLGRDLAAIEYSDARPNTVLLRARRRD